MSEIMLEGHLTLCQIRYKNGIIALNNFNVIVHED